MTPADKPSEPLRGDAAWRAQRAQVAKNNDAAYARARAERDAKSARVAAARRAADKRENASLPVQPEP